MSDVTVADLNGDVPQKRTRVSKTASTASDTARKMTRQKRAVVVGDNVPVQSRVQPLTDNELKARAFKKYSTTTFGFNSRKAYSGGSSVDVAGSTQGNFYSPQLSTDFLEKPQNLRERRAWYRTFYNSNEFVGQAIDLHSTLPISKIKLDKPKSENQDYADYIYDFFIEMCSDMKLSKTLLEISHDYTLLGNCITGDMEVRCLDGIKKAKDVKKGDSVLTHNKRFRKVVNTCCREAEDILSLRVCKDYRDLEITTEHPIEVLRDGKFIFIQSKDLLESDYVRVTWPADIKDVDYVNYINYPHLVKTDYGYKYSVLINRSRNEEPQKVREVLLSWLKGLKKPQIVDRDELSKKLNIRKKVLDKVCSQLRKEGLNFSHKIGAKGYQKGSQVEWLPIKNWEDKPVYTIERTHRVKTNPELKIDEDFCYLVGYWLGDGTLGRDKKRATWGRGIWYTCFGKGSEEHIPRVEGILKSKLGDKSIKKWVSKGITYIKVNTNPAFIEWWAENFGETSHGNNFKKIPQWFVDLPIKKLEHFLSGIVDSDGNVDDENDYQGIKIAMSSKNLIDMIRDISFKCGVIFNYRVIGPRLTELPNGKSIMSKHMYYLYTLEKQSISTLTKFSCKKIVDDYTFAYEDKFFKRVGNDIAFKVRHINRANSQKVYNFEVEEDHTYQVNGISTHNCFIFCEDHDPYSKEDEAGKELLKEKGKLRTKELFEKFKIVDKDPNYKGFRKLVILPPDQVRVKKIPLSDDSLIEFMPDPETKKTITGMIEGSPLSYDYRMSDSDKLKVQENLPEIMFEKLKEGGAIPLDTDPNSGSHCFHLSRKKSQYETMGVSILERCVNTLLYHDKLRQAQTSIASRHMTPMRVVWAEGMSDNDTDVLREQVDIALVDPDFSIITNFEVHWEEMGSNGRLLDLSSEFEHIENALFAGLGVTREILTGEGSYAGNRINLEILNTQYLLFREQLQEFVEETLFKPVARKKGFEEEDKFGRKKLLYPHLSFSRLAVRDNDAFFDQAFNMFNKGSLSVDIIHDMMNIDTHSTKKKLEADLFTVNDANFNQLLQNLYTSLGTVLAEKYDTSEKIASYLGLNALPQPAEGAEGGDAGGGLPGMGRFSSNLGKDKQAALMKLMEAALKHPEKLEKISKFLNGAKK